MLCLFVIVLFLSVALIFRHFPTPSSCTYSFNPFSANDVSAVRFGPFEFGFPHWMINEPFLSLNSCDETLEERRFCVLSDRPVTCYLLQP